MISASNGNEKVVLLDGSCNQLSKRYVGPWIYQPVAGDGRHIHPGHPQQRPQHGGSAHLHIRPWISQNPNSFGFAQVNQTQVFTFDGADDTWHESPFLHFGGFAEAQYYFTNQWFMNVDFGMRGILGFNQAGSYINALAAAGSSTYGLEFEPRSVEQVAAALWWRPIAALKFGLEYEYIQAKYLANIGEGGGIKAGTAAYENPSDRGTEHRVEFVGFFYF